VSSDGGGKRLNLHELSEEEDPAELYIQVNERSVQDEIILEMSMNYMLETLIMLGGENVSRLFLSYDCQPFSENVVGKAIAMLMKWVSSKGQDAYFRLFDSFLSLFQAKGQ
jgi:hypothetical protein